MINDLFIVLSGVFLLLALWTQSKEKQSEIHYLLSLISFIIAVSV